MGGWPYILPAHNAAALLHGSARLFKSFANQLKQKMLSTPVRRRHSTIADRFSPRNDQRVDDSAPATGYTMQALPGRPRYEQIVLKWHELAQHRLDYYAELYRSGRWRHYYTQERFAVRMLDVIEAAKRWRDLAGLPRPQRSESQSLPESKAGRDDKLRPAA